MTPGREHESLSTWAEQKILWSRKEEAVLLAALMLEKARFRFPETGWDVWPEKVLQCPQWGSERGLSHPGES